MHENLNNADGWLAAAIFNEFSIAEISSNGIYRKIKQLKLQESKLFLQ